MHVVPLGARAGGRFKKTESIHRPEAVGCARFVDPFSYPARRTNRSGMEWLVGVDREISNDEPRVQVVLVVPLINRSVDTWRNMDPSPKTMRLWLDPSRRFHPWGPLRAGLVVTMDRLSGNHDTLSCGGLSPAFRKSAFCVSVSVLMNFNVANSLKLVVIPKRPFACHA